jgi:hypothetical protein
MIDRFSIAGYVLPQAARNSRPNDANERSTRSGERPEEQHTLDIPRTGQPRKHVSDALAVDAMYD